MKDGDGGGQDGKGKLYNYILISKHKRSNKKNWFQLVNCSDDRTT